MICWFNKQRSINHFKKYWAGWNWWLSLQHLKTEKNQSNLFKITQPINAKKGAQLQLFWLRNVYSSCYTRLPPRSWEAKTPWKVISWLPNTYECQNIKLTRDRIFKHLNTSLALSISPTLEMITNWFVIAPVLTSSLLSWVLLQGFTQIFLMNICWFGQI